MKEDIPVVDKTSTLSDVKVAKFDVNKRYTKPHKHNKYLEIVFFTGGEGYHFLDLKNYKIEPPVLFFITKNQVHHWEIDAVPRGYVIIIKESYLNTTKDKSINARLLQLNGINKLSVPSEKAEQLENLFKALCNEFEEFNPKTEIFEGIFNVILMYLIDCTNRLNGNNQNLGLLFLNMIPADLKINVGHYAGKLNMTPQNLNSLCKKIFNQTASEVIAQHIIKEVKYLLVYTDFAVSDIAYKLGFQDTSNFIKYFKRHTGLTPLKYKKIDQEY
ncbi:helix-turn-helix domain-containing protein [Sinomicrobium pectinilyticum]|uniref:Helix-turn-helix domain-containing protein n=1 Tax=Sinomicrobium pectinilyticum TaxID=1084421 RepID=A0A3N0D0T6_SINP1|nr:helix-turn-helix domain-containing protein [Sinomicrobium pectinilyticum]RNL69270.1 helix-turn-helix domain-containing protein [Sinomicrobium pectinilyticum]